MLFLCEHALEYAANIRMTTDSGDFYIKLLTNEEALMKYIDVCLDMYHNRHIDTIKESIEAIEYYLKLFQLIDISTTNNIYRQAFIQLIALFDAIVFDCVRT